jgi:hypothetical protein
VRISVQQCGARTCSLHHNRILVVVKQYKKHLFQSDDQPNGKSYPTPLQERPKSPPWHHTNPLARIHPDWEESAVLARIMEKLGSKGGGRRRRERRLGTVGREMAAAMAKEPGFAKPTLLVTPKE